ISGLNTFTFVAADFLLHSGFIRPVAIPYAELCFELVVSLCSGRIVRLVGVGFAWRALRIIFLNFEIGAVDWGTAVVRLSV
ncbi:hypothetical protein JW933_02770, partial [candidate division FCPU426 bacterium]|nr:hypothetical protein [candidate division FCPU426 bacterium]